MSKTEADNESNEEAEWNRRQFLYLATVAATGAAVWWLSESQPKLPRIKNTPLPPSPTDTPKPLTPTPDQTTQFQATVQSAVLQDSEYLKSTATALPQGKAAFKDISPLCFTNAARLNIIAMDSLNSTNSYSGSGFITDLAVVQRTNYQDCYIGVLTVAHGIIGDHENLGRLTPLKVDIQRPQSGTVFQLDDGHQSGVYGTCTSADVGYYLVKVNQNNFDFPDAGPHLADDRLNSLPLSGLGFPATNIHGNSFFTIPYSFPPNSPDLLSKKLPPGVHKRPGLAFFGASGTALLGPDNRVSALIYAFDFINHVISITEIPKEFSSVRQACLDYIHHSSRNLQGLIPCPDLPDNYRRNFLLGNF